MKFADFVTKLNNQLIDNPNLADMEIGMAHNGILLDVDLPEVKTVHVAIDTEDGGRDWLAASYDVDKVRETVDTTGCSLETHEMLVIDVD